MEKTSPHTDRRFSGLLHSRLVWFARSWRPTRLDRSFARRFGAERQHAGAKRGVAPSRNEITIKTHGILYNSVILSAKMAWFFHQFQNISTTRKIKTWRVLLPFSNHPNPQRWVQRGIPWPNEVRGRKTRQSWNCLTLLPPSTSTNRVHKIRRGLFHDLPRSGTTAANLTISLPPPHWAAQVTNNIFYLVKINPSRGLSDLFYYNKN